MHKKETKREAFKRIAEARTNKILTTINLMKNFKNASFYEFTNDDINKMCDCIVDNVNDVRNILIR